MWGKSVQILMNVIVGFSCNRILLCFFSYFLKGIFSQIPSAVTNVGLRRVIFNFLSLSI